MIRDVGRYPSAVQLRSLQLWCQWVSRIIVDTAWLEHRELIRNSPFWYASGATVQVIHVQCTANADC